MAAKTGGQNKHEIFWSKTDMDSSDEEDAYIPGISAPGNRRPTRVCGRKTKEVNAKIPLSQPFVEHIPDSKNDDLAKAPSESRAKTHSYPSSKVRPIEKPQQRVSKDADQVSNVRGQALTVSGGRNTGDRRARGRGEVNESTKRQVEEILSCTLGDVSDSMSSAMESFAERSIRRLQKASLKDLRPEDKQRVANLIKELARVGEEKEKAVMELHGEREHYEKQVLTLVEQQEKILKEREEVQEKLFQCQQLLTDYQAQILNHGDRPVTTQGSKRKLPKPPVVPVKSAVVIEAPIGSQGNPTGILELLPPDSPTSCGKDQPPPVAARAQHQEVIQVKNFYQSERQSRSHDHPASMRLANLNANNHLLTNPDEDNESVSDLLMQTQDPAERVKRPFTSMIDKEIARERSHERSMERSLGHLSQRSRSASGSPSHGRPKFSYSQKSALTGPLHEPIASSTHKSMEINAQLSNVNTFDPDSPRSSLRGSSVRGHSPLNNDKPGKVAFIETPEKDNDVKLHSPNLQTTKTFKNPEYVDYYKKLSPSGRKHELLRQRQALLNEQERLKQVLERQEQQLKERHAEYEKRQELQKERMEFYKTGGKFPALRLDFDADSERGDRQMDMNGEHADGQIGLGGDDGVTLQMVVEDEGNRVEEMGRVTPDKGLGIDDVHTRSRISAATSPIAHHGHRISVATSPVQSHSSGGSGTPRMVDVATSVSYRTPLKDASNRQGNLPLYGNRHRHSPSVHQGHSPALRQEVTPGSRTPGEKTLTVVELVNSLDDGPVHLDSAEADRENKPRYQPMVPGRPQHLSSRLHHNEWTSPRLKNVGSSRTRSSHSAHSNLPGDKEESQEESKILEDIFFL